MAVMEQAGLDALHRLKSTDPPQWLAPSSDFSRDARTAAKHLFSSLNPHAPKSPLPQLLVDGFDAEQIWQQIDLQSKPLLSMLGREIKLFEKNPEEISKLKDALVGEKKAPVDRSEALEEESDDELDEGFDEEDGDEDGEGVDEEEGSESEEEEDEEEGEGVEDKFLKIKELKDYLKKDEAGEFGLKKKKKMNTEEDDEDDEEEDDELELFGDDDDDEEDGAKLARYEDFYGTTKKKTLKRESGLIDGSEDSATDEEEGEEELEEEEDIEEEEDDEDLVDDQKKGNLSTHEKQLEKVRSKIEQMEKANLEEKTWTMQGEVTAAKRPRNSALEVDLDFEHNVRPAPVITEEVTASLEELIQKRILEGRFDDVQKAPRLSTKAPRETKELDENKSKKGLAEVYEEEYVQKVDPASAPLTFSDEQKKEASTLFKRLCLKLDALSHFHFAPKPVIEDMSIQTNVPALAMEEIAPLAVSDAAMLAPEEVFAGKGDFKEEAELTQAERKRRRANKKRKYKAETIMRMGNKAQKTLSTPNAGKEE